MFTVAVGTKAILIKPDGTKFSFYTRQHLDFRPNERVFTKVKGHLAFRRKGYTLLVEGKLISIRKKILDLISEGVARLAGFQRPRTEIVVGVEKKDDEILTSMSQRRELTACQAVFGANLIRKYREKLPAYITHAADMLIKGRE